MIRPCLLMLASLALLGAPAASEDDKGGDSTTKPGKVKVRKKPINRFFKGKVLELDPKKKTITLYYDFEDPAQLEDFEDARPPRLLDATQNQYRIQGGRLVLEGSTGIRHKIEGTAEYRARFYVRLSAKTNVGTVFTEPILSEHYILLNLFDDRMYKSGSMFLCGVGMHEDEGAEDPGGDAVNWRDIWASNIRNKVKLGQDIEVEVAKNGHDEFCRAGDTKGGGSSKGKARLMPVYQFGLWVHHNRATFDDLTLTLTINDKFLELNDVLMELSEAVEQAPDTGLLAGVKGVPPGTRSSIEEYGQNGGDPTFVIEAMANPALTKKAREVSCQLLCDRKDAKVVPAMVYTLYSEDRDTREFGIKVVKAVVGKAFGYKARNSEKSRSKAVQKLNGHMLKNRSKFYG